MKGGWVIPHSLGETARLPAPFSFLFLTNQGMASLCRMSYQDGLQRAQSTRASCSWMQSSKTMAPNKIFVFIGL